MTGKKEKAMEMLVSGDLKLGEIAERLKISEKTLYNWRQDEEFDRELRRRLNIKMGTLAASALKTQSSLLKAESDMVKHLAAKDILNRAGFVPDSNVNINGSEKVEIISQDRLDMLANLAGYEKTADK